MKLIYRAQVIEIATPAPQVFVMPHALNWRFQVPDMQFSRAVKSMYQQPKALNWRFQWQSSMLCY